MLHFILFSIILCRSCWLQTNGGNMLLTSSMTKANCICTVFIFAWQLQHYKVVSIRTALGAVGH